MMGKILWWLSCGAQPNQLFLAGKSGMMPNHFLAPNGGGWEGQASQLCCPIHKKPKTLVFKLEYYCHDLLGISKHF